MTHRINSIYSRTSFIISLSYNKQFRFNNLVLLTILSIMFSFITLTLPFTFINSFISYYFKLYRTFRNMINFTSTISCGNTHSSPRAQAHTHLLPSLRTSIHYYDWLPSVPIAICNQRLCLIVSMWMTTRC